MLSGLLLMSACGSDGPPTAEPAEYATHVCEASRVFSFALRDFDRAAGKAAAKADDPAQFQQFLTEERDLFAGAVTAANTYSATVNDEALPRGDEFSALRASLSRIIDDLRGALNQGRANFDLDLATLTPADAVQIDQNLDATFADLDAAIKKLRDALDDAVNVGSLKSGKCDVAVLNLGSLVS